MGKNFVSNKDETVRLFRNNLLESLSHMHWSMPLWVFVPVVVYCLYRSGWQFPIEVLVWIAAGLLIWTLTEYSVHRFVFHHEPSRPWMKKVHYFMHRVHHDYPMDSKRLVMPPAASIPLAVLFYYLFAVIFRSHLMPLFAGFIAGYLCYDMTHYRIHHRPMRWRVARAIKNHHIRHHFEDPTRGFGVTTPLWDYILHTEFGRKQS